MHTIMKKYDLHTHAHSHMHVNSTQHTHKFSHAQTYNHTNIQTRREVQTATCTDTHTDTMRAEAKGFITMSRHENKYAHVFKLTVGMKTSFFPHGAGD
jgi:hypothetical protein